VSAALAVQDELAGIDPLHAASHSGALCGLALAGANQAPQTDRDDGILTAYEVSALDLRHVDLVVLSGCETALGDSAPGEGAMSLQRAFQIAGAGTTVASLWSVPDEKTKDLMHLFLTNMWQKKMPKLEALRAAQISILHGSNNLAANDFGSTRNLTNPAVNVGAMKNVSAVNSSSEGKSATARPATLPPYYWAAFVLSGDWR
jgi:CHAT domain-containing protein